MDHETEQAIARDLELCDIGMALTKGRTRRKFVAHRKACMEAIAAANRAHPENSLSDDELLAELAA